MKKKDDDYHAEKKIVQRRASNEAEIKKRFEKIVEKVFSIKKVN